LNLSHYLYFARHNLESHLLGRRKPLLTGFKLTDRCNLRCRVCPFWKRETPEMTLAQVQDVLDRLYREGVRLLILEGGEPFLWHDGSYGLEDIVTLAKERFFFTGVVTNGIIPIETQADAVWVSVDGLRESHNYNRGPTFDKVIEHIEAARHPKLFASVTINARNWQDIPELVYFLTGKVKGITIQFYYPYEGTEDLYLPVDKRRKVLDQLIQLKREGYPVSDSIPALQALRDNTWHCAPWLISSVEPDGQITYGCYLKNRAAVNCTRCGFAAHTEISMAYRWNLAAIRAGIEIFGI
jgi:MoaA/NifB/PqqE/SkfB family radical SAM enzyme